MASVLGDDDEPVELVVDDADRVELEEPSRHDERGLARVADGPVPPPGGAGGVAAHPVVGVQPSLRLRGGQHEFVAAEERDELLPVAPHVGPALRGLLLVTEDEVGLPGRQVDRQPPDLAGGIPGVPELVAGGEPVRVVVGQRQQGRGEEGAGPGAEPVHPVAELVDEVQRRDRIRRRRGHLEHAAHAVGRPVEDEVAVGLAQPVLRGEPLGGGQPPGRAHRLAQFDGARDLLWTHGNRS